MSNAPFTPETRSGKQREASCRNGAKSRGLAIPASKAASSRNAVKHGLCAKKTDPAVEARIAARCDEIFLEHCAQLQPEGAAELVAVMQMADSCARLEDLHARRNAIFRRVARRFEHLGLSPLKLEGKVWAYLSKNGGFLDASLREENSLSLRNRRAARHLHDLRRQKRSASWVENKSAVTEPENAT
jgi:hypothetical protein